MEIIYFKSLPSTQKYLVEAIKKEKLKAPIIVVAKNQTDGIGSRNNIWSGDNGNLFLSFAIKELPKDLELASSSIYFAFLMKEVLLEFKKDIWIKWPNDIYLKNEKVGGIITKVVDNNLICGIGVNLKSSNLYKGLNIEIEPLNIVKEYKKRLLILPLWKQVFSQYKIEFEKSREFFVHIDSTKKSLKDAILCEDGSLIIEKRKVFSLR